MNALATMPRYEEYRDSGVEWLGDIPTHWVVRKLKFEDLTNMGQSPDSNDCNTVENGIPFLQGNAEFGNLYPTPKLWCTKPKKIAQKGDLLLSVRAPVGAINVANQAVGIGRGLCAVTPKKSHISFKFYQLSCASIALKKLITGSTFEAVATTDISNLFLPVPSVSEQKAIAAFLDTKTTQIDQTITTKQKQIELLKERRQILIQNAVTRGLDPQAPTQDSGVEWIGEIPAHWGVRRSKFLFTQRIERSRPDDIQLSATQAYGVIPQEEYEAMIGRKVVKIQFHLDKRKHVEVNDFVISMRSFQGGLERAWASGCIRSSYVVLRPLQEVDAAYYAYLFKSRRYIEALQSTGNFIRDGQDLNFENFSKVDLFIPPLEEQRMIAAHIKSQMEKIDKAITLQQQQITKLKEYRATLINSAVTGKIKVV